MLMCAGCGKGEKESAALRNQDPRYARAKDGQRLFQSRTFGRLPIACSDCHAEYPDHLKSDARILAGHSILGAARRTSTWAGEFSGERLTSTAAGAARCAWQYQQKGSRIEEALSSEEADALMAYFEFISPGDELPTLEWNALAWPGMKTFDQERFSAKVARIYELSGDPAKGAEVFRLACYFCHTQEESRLGPSLSALKKRADELPRIVRAGTKSMPFFSTDKLSDQQVADLLAAVRAGLR